MLQRPGSPQLAPENPTDNEIADERMRFGAHIRLLECKFDGLVAWILEKPQPCTPTK